MGSITELEVHAYFHNYHGKLKFVGSQLLKSRPDLPCCNQGMHSNNLVPEGSDGYVCQWEQCDVSSLHLSYSEVIKLSIYLIDVIMGFFFFKCTFNNPEWFYRHVDNHVESAEPQSLPQQQQALFCQWAGTTGEFMFFFHVTLPVRTSCHVSCFIHRLRRLFQDQVPFERTHAKPHSGETRRLSYMRQHVLQQHKAVRPPPQAGRASRWDGRLSLQRNFYDVLMFLPHCWLLYMYSSKQRRWFVNIVAKLFPARGFWGITFVSMVSFHPVFLFESPQGTLYCKDPTMKMIPYEQDPSILVLKHCDVILSLLLPVNQVKCPFCDMTCTTLAALKIHIRFRHCDERPFPCDFCDKR